MSKKNLIHLGICHKECNEIRLQIDDLKRAQMGFDEYCRYGISLLSDLPYNDSNATLEGKQKMLGSIFPDFLRTENIEPRNLMRYSLYIATITTVLEKKKGQEANFRDLSLMVTPTVRLSNQLMESFKRIYDLKDVVPVRLLDSATIPYRLRKVI